MIGIISSKEYIKDVRASVNVTEISFEKSGSFKPEEFIQHCQAAARINLQTFILDLTCTDDATIIKGVRLFRFHRNTRILLLAPDRNPGDLTISELVGLSVWDIVAPILVEDEDPDISGIVKSQLESNLSYGNASRWHVSVSMDNQDKKKPIMYKKEEQREQEEHFRVFPNQLVLVGSVYPGAGSSFITLMLSRMLHYLNIPNAVVESPVNIPELYSVLYGEQNAPDKYQFTADQVHQSGMISKSIDWALGESHWYVQNPAGTKQQTWTYQQHVKILNSIKQPIVFYDISHHWGDPGLKELCYDADEILFVMDTFPSKLSRPDTEKTVQYMNELRKAGKNTHLVANRDVVASKRSEWLQSLPFVPSCTIPNIPYEDVIETMWNGDLVFDLEEVRESLLPSIYPLLSKLVPASFPLKPPKEKKSGFLSRFGRQKS